MHKIRHHAWDITTRIHRRTWHFSKDTDWCRQQGLQLWTDNKMMKSWMQTSRIPKVKKVISSKLCSLLQNLLQIYSSTTLSKVMNLQILACQQQWRGPNSGQASAIGIMTVCGFPHITLDKTVFGWEQYQCYNFSVLTSFDHKKLSWFHLNIFERVFQLGLDENIQSNVIPILNRLFQMSSSSVSRNNWH